MKELTIGERIILAERQKESLEKEYKFCRDIATGKINLKVHYAYMLIPVVFPDYVFDDDEQYELEQMQIERPISKKQFIRQRKDQIRQRAKDDYKSAIFKYDNLDDLIGNLREKIVEAMEIINKAKRKHPISYFMANQPASRMFSPSFTFSLIGQNIVDGFKGQKYMSDIEKLKMYM